MGFVWSKLFSDSRSGQTTDIHAPTPLPELERKTAIISVTPHGEKSENVDIDGTVYGNEQDRETVLSLMKAISKEVHMNIKCDYCMKELKPDAAKEAGYENIQCPNCHSFYDRCGACKANGRNGCPLCHQV